jgi:predicted RND superfamily exporter protein
MVGEKKFKKISWIGLSVFILITAVLGYHLKDIRFDYNFENFFPSHDKETSFFFDYRDDFQSDNDFLLISIENDKGIFNSQFLKKLDTLSKELEKIKYVENVRSITSENEQFIFPGGTTSSKPYIDLSDFDANRDSSRIFKNDELINTFIAENGKAICIFIKHEDYLSKKKSDALVKSIDNITNELGVKNVRLAGRAVGQAYYINKMIFELSLFLGLSAFLIILFLYIAFKSIWGILIPQIVIVGSLVWTIGGMGLFDEPVNIILTVLPSVMFVVCMSDVIHLVSKYLDALRVEKDTFTAIKVAVKEVGLATFLTSLTTSIGFFSLYFVQVQPIQVFGVILGIGVLIAFVLTFLTLPILFYIFPGPKHIRRAEPKDHFWKTFLEKAFVFVLKKRKSILITSGIVLIISLIGMFQIETNNFMMDDLKESEQMKKDFNFFDDNFGGIRPFELAVLIKGKSTKVWDKGIIQKLDSVETYLEKEYGVTVKVSLVKILKTLNRSAHAGNIDEYQIPTSNKKIRSFKRIIKLADKGRFVYSFIDSSEHRTRISGTIPDIGNVSAREKTEKFYAFLKKNHLEDQIEFKITGTGHLLDKNMRYLAVSLVKGLGVSIILVALIIGFVYRSGRILIISVITNVLPLLFIAGYMGFTGVELKTSTSIIFTIAFGIAVDDTIHFLGKFKYELMKGKGKIYALKRSYLTTGKAMILTTLILSSGFLLLVFSSFLGTFYMGLLLCITFAVALVADLTLLPVLLLLFYKEKPKSPKD